MHAERPPLVLLVEDNEDDAILATLALRQSGLPHRLRVARDGQQAIDYLTSDEPMSDPPALILLDMKLPRRDGRDVLRTLRGTPCVARVPVVLLTSSRLEQDVLDAYTLGANSYFPKPIDFGVFRSGISVLLSKWLALNVPPPPERGEGVVITPSLPDLGVPLPFQKPPGSLLQSEPAPVRRASDILVIDGDDADRAATLQGLDAALENATKVVGLGTFDEVAAFLQGVGGPPPQLDDRVPRVIFIDANVKGGDARDLIQALRYRADHHIVIVVFTRDPTPEFVADCYRLKVNSVSRKPADPDAYRTAVALLSHYWIHMNEPPPTPGRCVRARSQPG
ncbi:MAG: response regulator [Myxococcota bacterium]